MSTTLPPVGVEPRHIWVAERRRDLEAAIERYIAASLTVPQEWLEELNQTDLIIEVCEREMDCRWVEKIGADNNGRATTQMIRVPKYHAQLKDNPGIWACGDTPDDAVGDLIRHHPTNFNITTVYLGKLRR